MSKRRDRSSSEARRAISTRRPSQTASNSARVMTPDGARGALHEDLVLAGLAEDQKAAVAQHRDARQRRAGRAAPNCC